jgi:hypothetical protein
LVLCLQASQQVSVGPCEHCGQRIGPGLFDLFVQAQSNPDDDWMDYNNELRIGILDAYSGIFQGLGSGEMQLRSQS